MKNFHVHWLDNKQICNFFSTHYSKVLLKNHCTSNEPMDFIFLKIKLFIFPGIEQKKKIFIQGSCTWRHTWILPIVFFCFFFKPTFFFLNYYLFIYLFLAVLGLRFCARASSSCGKWGPLFIAVHGPHYRGLSLRSTGSRRAGSVVVAHGPSCSAACGIFPDQGSNPCPLH